MAAVDPPQFNPHLREQQLRTEADGWDVADPEQAVAEDLTVIDVSGWKPTLGLRPAPIANAVRDACERVGFFQITGHGLSSRIIEQATSMNRAFHALPLETKMSIAMDQPGAIGGVGYLPIGHNKLPKRAVGNRNAAFIVKTSADLMADDNLWPTEAELPGFRRAVTDYLTAISDLAMQVVTLYEAALGLDPGFLDTAFTGPLARLRFSHYPPGEVTRDQPEQFGIAPHVDTTFFTLLLQDGPGLTVFDAERGRWVRVPVIDNAFVVNSGELLRHWSNDRFLSARHFANNLGATDRYSIPFFFNANADYPMVCLPTCAGPGNPSKYPTISYRQSQAAVQGE